MFTELYQYLIHHKKLSVPGIGTFLMERHSAVADFPSRQIHAPYFAIALIDDAPAPTINFYQNLARIIGCTDREAVVHFNDFNSSFKKNIDKGDQINWTGVGVLKKLHSGTINFTPGIPLMKEEPVQAEKVLRQKSEHTVRVGEDEKTSEEMTAYFNQAEEKKSYWWVWGSVLALLSFLFLGWHLSSNGIDALGNQQILTPLEPPANTYTFVD